jgi:hypothetical protein
MYLRRPPDPNRANGATLLRSHQKPRFLVAANEARLRAASAALF